MLIYLPTMYPAQYSSKSVSKRLMRSLPSLNGWIYRKHKYRNQKQRSNFALSNFPQKFIAERINHVCVSNADGGRNRILICPFLQMFFDDIVDILKVVADSYVAILIQVVVQLKNHVGPRWNILVILTDGGKHITIPRNLVFIPVLRCSFFFYQVLNSLI